jgi:hypothetical protein
MNIQPPRTRSLPTLLAVCLWAWSFSGAGFAQEKPADVLTIEDSASDANYGKGQTDPAYELHGIQLRRVGEKTLQITFEASAAHSEKADNFGWYACYFDLDNDAKTGEEVLQLGYEVALGVELAREGGKWLSIVHVPPKAAQKYEFTATDPVVKDGKLSVEITSDAFLKYPLMRMIGVANRGGDFIDYAPDDSVATVGIFPVGKEADADALKNAASEEFMLSAEGGHYDRHRIKIPPKTTAARVKVTYVEEYFDKRWASSTGFGLGEVNVTDPNKTKIFARLSHNQEKNTSTLRLFGVANEEKIPFSGFLKPGMELVWEATWSNGNLEVRLNGEVVWNGKLDFVPEVLHLSICGAKIAVQEVEFE